ncbi:hypothetical protein HK098_005989 [Nowakowskiella sp. JEL0407]|nr:hypothetical protein HK098_005989 [Nowakowskiella sp. JEL0407]
MQPLKPPKDLLKNAPAETWGILMALTPKLQTVYLTKAPSVSAVSHTILGANGSAVVFDDKLANGYVIGKHSQCDIEVNHWKGKISNRHCVVYRKFGMRAGSKKPEFFFVIEDCSTNGTFVNGSRLIKDQPKELHSGDFIQLARYLPGSKVEKFDDDFYIFYDPAVISKDMAEATATVELQAQTVRDKYDFTKKLGSGHFATVYHAAHKQTHKPYAIKVIEKKVKMNPKSIEHIRQEIGILMSIKHPSVIRIEGVFEEKKEVYMVLELVEGGELFERIVDSEKFSESHTRLIMFQLLSALKYLHSRGISHRDLKPENILLCSKDINNMKIKVSDFGLAKIVGKKAFLKTICGTPDYAAPEILSAQTPYTNAVDLWSCGVILYVCLCGYPPFSDEVAPPKMEEQIKLGKYEFQDPWWTRISSEAKDLITRMLTVDPQQRISAEEALDHPFMKLTPQEITNPAVAELINWHYELKKGMTVMDVIPEDEYDEEEEVEEEFEEELEAEQEEGQESNGGSKEIEYFSLENTTSFLSSHWDETESDGTRVTETISDGGNPEPGSNGSSVILGEPEELTETVTEDSVPEEMDNNLSSQVNVTPTRPRGRKRVSSKSSSSESTPTSDRILRKRVKSKVDI